jgi:hypothetical protein
VENGEATAVFLDLEYEAAAFGSEFTARTIEIPIPTFD